MVGRGVGEEVASAPKTEAASICRKDTRTAQKTMRAKNGSKQSRGTLSSLVERWSRPKFTQKRAAKKSRFLWRVPLCTSRGSPSAADRVAAKPLPARASAAASAKRQASAKVPRVLLPLRLVTTSKLASQAKSKSLARRNRRRPPSSSAAALSAPSSGPSAPPSRRRAGRWATISPLTSALLARPRIEVMVERSAASSASVGPPSP